MATLRVTLLGMDATTTAIGLALARYSRDSSYSFVRTGYDTDDDVLRQVRKQEAIDNSQRNLARAVAEADIIVMNLRYDERAASYRTIAAAARAGVVVFDLAATKADALSIARASLQPKQHAVGLTVKPGPAYIDMLPTLANATASTFDKSLALIVTEPGTPPAAVDLATNFAVSLGAKPRYVEPLEHDSLLTVSSLLPQLLSTALLNTASQHPAWRDIRPVAGRGFNSIASLSGNHADDQRDQLIAGGDTVQRALSDIITQLQALQDALQQATRSGDRSALEDQLGSASDAYFAWAEARGKVNPDDPDEGGSQVSSLSLSQTLLGTALSSRLFGSRDEDDA